MNRSAVRRQVRIPSPTTRKSQTKDYEFVGGIDSNSTNDDVNSNRWRYATDVRQPYVGQWRTRQGNDLLSIPIGEVVNSSQTSTIGASNFSFSTTTYFAMPLVAGSSGRLTALEANVRNTSLGTGTVVLALYTNVAGSPGVELMRTTIAASQLTASYQYLKGRSITCPDIVAGTTYWLVGFVQTGGTGSYQISTTTVVTTGKTSTNNGQTYSAQTYGFNVRLSTATAGGVKGTYRVQRPNGTSYTFLAVGTSLYQVNETTGVTTVVDGSLDSSSTVVRFDYVADVLRYVQGTSKPRKYDFTTASSVTTAPENASCIINHKGLEFFASSDDPNKFYFTNFGIYDTFTSTDFFYAPSPKTSDPLVGFSKLLGALFVHTRNNKYVLTGAENATFSLDNATGQKGTFSQESIAYDEDYIYLASDDGIYRFNGAEEINICTLSGSDQAGVLDWWTALFNKQNTILELFNNRLYVFYTPNGQATNSRCKVYNILYSVWESDDTKAFIGHTYSSAATTNYYIQASNRVGMLMLSEQTTNDYNTMGEPFTYELKTNYDHYQAPAQLKRAPNYRPHFTSVTGNYAMTIGYATDYSDSFTTKDISLTGSGARFDTGVLFDSGVTFNGTTQINPMDSSLVIAGLWRRLQIRYYHYAAREPVDFDGHILTIEADRIL